MRSNEATQYEFFNLPITIGMGNVLRRVEHCLPRLGVVETTTVNDKKILVDVGNDGTIDWYVADITSATDSAKCYFETYTYKVQNLHWLIPMSKSLKFDKSELLRIHNRYYYPFSSPMDGRTFSSDKYRFGFNGQEKDDEVAGAGNINTALYWEYDTRLGRRWNLDPKPQVSISDYAVMGCNPIVNIDLLGDEFGKADKEKIDEEVIPAIDAKLKTLEKSKSELELGTKGRALTEDENNRLNDYKAKIKSLNDAKSEINEMAVSMQRFTFNYQSSGSRFLSGGGKAFIREGVCVLQYSNLSSLIHELKHGNQFLKGTLDLPKEGGGSKSLYDLNDEVEAYQRDFAFDEKGDSRYFSASSLKDIDAAYVLKHLDDNKTYAKLPTESLDLNSRDYNISAYDANKGRWNYSWQLTFGYNNSCLGSVSIDAIINFNKYHFNIKSNC